MAIIFETTTPNKLLSAFKKAIDDGHVVTWMYDSVGDFTHVPDQWKYKAWLSPAIFSGQNLTMNMLGNNNIVTSKALYGIYHGRFIESMLTHCDQLFTNCYATALATNSDVITKAA
jgi:hypothetical protein